MYVNKYKQPDKQSAKMLKNNNKTNKIMLLVRIMHNGQNITRRELEQI